MPAQKSTKSWIQKILQGDLRTVARTCSLFENEDPLSESILSEIYRYTGNAFVLGITGPPGVGKSSLLSSLVEEAVRHGYQVGVIAVDPTSPLTGGALLADRLRMANLNHNSVFVRSLATRGTLGGLAFASFGILRTLEAMGKNFIFVETVGAGQNEVEVSHLATSTLYVTIPHLGDEIQALKAGILEVCDIFLVNKADLGNAEVAISQLRAMLTLKESSTAFPGKDAVPIWSPPILSCSALKKQGIAQIFHAVLQHFEYLKSTGELFERKRKQVQAELAAIMERRIAKEVESKLTTRATDLLLSKKSDPATLAKKILRRKQ